MRAVLIANNAFHGLGLPALATGALVQHECMAEAFRTVAVAGEMSDPALLAAGIARSYPALQLGIAAAGLFWTVGIGLRAAEQVPAPGSRDGAGAADGLDDCGDATRAR
jgi:hypothetical protein